MSEFHCPACGKIINVDDLPNELKDDILYDCPNSRLEKLALEGKGFSLEDFYLIDNKKIHDSVWLPKAYTDGEYVWFVGINEEYAKKWLYYIGAENEANIVWFDGVNRIYGNISASRLSRFLPNEGN